jgi:hypothetical protein
VSSWLLFIWLISIFSSKDFATRQQRRFSGKAQVASSFPHRNFVTLTNAKNWSEKRKFKGWVVCETSLMADSYWTLGFEAFPPNLLICQKFRKPGRKNFGASPVQIPSKSLSSFDQEGNLVSNGWCIFNRLIQNCVFACCKNELTCLTKKFKMPLWLRKEAWR